jgi:hypothetical protein
MEEGGGVFDGWTDNPVLKFAEVLDPRSFPSEPDYLQAPYEEITTEEVTRRFKWGFENIVPTIFPGMGGEDVSFHLRIHFTL